MLSGKCKSIQSPLLLHKCYQPIKSTPSRLSRRPYPNRKQSKTDEHIDETKKKLEMMKLQKCLKVNAYNSDNLG